MGSEVAGTPAILPYVGDWHGRRGPGDEQCRGGAGVPGGRRSRQRRREMNMDVLVVVGEGRPPERVAARAAHLVRVGAAGPGPDTVADIRGHIPREVGVWGADSARVVESASRLFEAGFP